MDFDARDETINLCSKDILKYSTKLHLFSDQGNLLFTNHLDHSNDQETPKIRIEQILPDFIDWSEAKVEVDRGYLFHYKTKDEKQFCYIMLNRPIPRSPCRYIHFCVPVKSQRVEQDRIWEEIFSIIERTSNMGTFIQKDLRIQYASNQFAEMVGRSVGELIGTNILDLLKEEDWDRELTYIRSGSKHIDEITLKSANRGDIPVLVHAAPCTYNGLESRVTIVRDISKEKTEESRFLKSEARFERFFQQQPVYCYIVSRSGEILDVNNSALDALGYSKYEMIGKPFWDLYSSDYREVVKRKIDHWFFDGDIETSTFDIQNKDGSLRKVLLKGQILPEESWETPKGIFVQSDMTELDEAKQTITRERSRADKYLEIADVAFLALDPSGRVEMANPKACEIVNASPDQVLGINWFEQFVSPDEQTLVKEVLRSLTSKEDKYKKNVNTIIDSKGMQKIIEWHNSPILDKAGNVTGILSSGLDITDRIKSEKRLKEKITQYELLVSNIPGIVYRCLSDEHRTMLNISDEVERRTGYPVTDFLENKVRSYASIIHPEDRKYVHDEVTKATKARSQFRIQYRIIHADGTDRWVQDIGAVLVNEDDELLLDGVIFDITADVRAQKKLAEREMHYRILFETMTQGVVYQNRDGKIILSNPAAERILGHPSNEMDGLNSFGPEWQSIREDGSAFPVEQHPSMVALETGIRIDNVVMGIMNPTLGERRWIRIDAIPLFENDSSDPYMVYTIFSDITSTKNTLEEIRKNEILFRGTIESTGDGMLILDENESVAYANSKFCQIWDLDVNLIEEQSQPLSFHLLSSKVKDQESFRRKIEKINRGPRDIREIIALQNGLIVQVYSQPIKISGGSNLKVWVFRDITDLKQAEESSKLLTDLMGHDLRNYLQGLLISLDILGLSQQKEGYLEDMRKIIEKCSGLIAKVKKTENLAESRLVQINLIEEVETSFQQLEHDHPNVDIRLEVAVSEAQVIGNEFTNILIYDIMENAIVHNTNSEKKVWISLKEEGNQYVLDITDNGPGIPDSIKDVLIGKTRRFGGVGLHQALMIAEKIQAKIQFTSPVNDREQSGTCVSILFTKIQ